MNVCGRQLGLPGALPCATPCTITSQTGWKLRSAWPLGLGQQDYLV